MNELIEELWDNHKTITFSGSGAFPEDYGELMYCKEFGQAIQTACKAQRNACAREYDRYSDPNNIELTKDYIKTAQIERQDYE